MKTNPAQGSIGFFSFTIKDVMGRGGEWDSWFRLDAYETSSQKPVRAELYSDLIKYENSGMSIVKY